MSDFILTENPNASLSVSESGNVVYSLAVAAELTGVHPELLRYYCRLRLLGEGRAQAEREPTFDDEALYEVRRIEHFRRHQGVNRSALPVLWELLHEVERLQNELHFLRNVRS